MKHVRLIVAALILALAWEGRRRPQPIVGTGAIPAELEKNKKLRVQLDRTSIRDMNRCTCASRRSSSPPGRMCR